MDYNTEKISKIINLYLMLNSNDVSYIRNEAGKFLKSHLLPALDNNDYESSDISDLTRKLSNDCKSIADNAAQLKGKNNRFGIILKEISSIAEDVSNYNNKPLVSQLVCLWYIFSSDKNQYKEKIIDLLKEKWKIKDDILADMSDTSVTLTELKENNRMVVTYAPKKVFSLRNLFRKNKMPEKKKLIEDEYKNDEQVLLNSIKELIATEAIRD
jgi:uncharacterized protein YdcH (DUF465 family)